MSTLKVGAIQSTTGNAAATVAANGNLTIPGDTTFSGSITGSFLSSSTTVSNLASSATGTISGIPTTAKIITFVSQGISTSTTANVNWRVITSGGELSSSSYEENRHYANNSSNWTSQNETSTESHFHSDWNAASNYYTFSITYTLCPGTTSNVYQYHGNNYNAANAQYYMDIHGRVFAGAPITGFRIFTSDGNNFDAGSIIAYSQG